MEEDKVDKIVKRLQQLGKKHGIIEEDDDEIVLENNSEIVPNQPPTQIELIRLKYPKKINEKIIKLIHSHLAPTLIEIDIAEFKKHFNISAEPFVKTQWNGTVAQIKALFDILEGKEPQYLKKEIASIINVNKLIAKHFLNKKGESFIEGVIAAERSKSSYNFKNQKYITEIASALQDLIEKS